MKSAKKSAKWPAKSANVGAKKHAGVVLHTSVSQMEPMWPASPALEEKAIALLKASQHLSGKLHPITQRQIAQLLRLMNSYYSNLIEGNVTHPLDLERAEKNDYSAEPRKRALQIEGRAHIEVQEELEEEVRTSDVDICSASFLRNMHKRLYDKLPEEFRVVRSPKGTALTVIPGEFRRDEVRVGHHIPPAHRSIPEFLRRFGEVYDPNPLGSIRKIIAAAAAHHRLAWIHPFLDGNGRVTRLFTHLYFIRAELDSNGLWSLARGLARRREDYYAALESADAQRYNDYDGRGNLSQRGLDAFVDFLLEVSIDQVQFMSGLLDIDGVLDRLAQYIDLLAIRGEVDETAKYVLMEIFLRGELPRGEVLRLTGTSERTSRRIVQSLVKLELVTSKTPLGPLRLNFPVKAVPILFPSLYPNSAI
ncbi:MAG: Fic family protein [Candidatus Kapaibacterium sp.]